MKIIKSYFKSKDQRGEIVGITQKEKIKEINFVESKKGTLRGGHYHKKTRELFFIIDGTIRISIENVKSKKKQRLTVKKRRHFCC